MKNRNDFCEEEKIGYVISSNRKKLWGIELDLLDCFEAICKEYDLNYSVLFGGAIGAIRHQGFIPWDDDIDLGMFREDFEKFRVIATKEFPEYVDIQYGYSEHGVDELLRIRDSRTTGITKKEVNMPGNKGAFIEIYPLDYVEDNWVRDVQLFILKQIYACMNIKVYGKKGKSLKFLIRKAISCLLSGNVMWEIYDKVSKLQNGKKRTYVDTISAVSPNTMRKAHLFKYEDMKNSIVVPFEYTNIRVAKGYDNMLRPEYGDYMQLPPIEKRGTHHSTAVFYDPNKTYIEYENSENINKFFEGDFSLSLL